MKLIQEKRDFLTLNEYAKIRRSKKKDTIITEDIMVMVSKVSESLKSE